MITKIILLVSVALVSAFVFDLLHIAVCKQNVKNFQQFVLSMSCVGIVSYFVF